MSDFIPIFYLHKKVLFPGSTMVLKTKSAGFGSMKAKDRILAFPIRGPLDILFSTGKMATLAEIQEIGFGNGIYTVNLHGLSRVGIGDKHGFREARFETMPPPPGMPRPEVIDELRRRAQELIFLINVAESDRLISLLNFLSDITQLGDFISNYFVVKFSKRYRIYFEPDMEKRVRCLMESLDALIRKIKLRGERILGNEKKDS